MRKNLLQRSMLKSHHAESYSAMSHQARGKSVDIDAHQTPRGAALNNSCTATRPPPAMPTPFKSARLPAPKASLPPLEALGATHRQMILALEGLSQLLEHLGNAGADAAARKLAGNLVKFFDQEARSHHAAEDRDVFPTLLESEDVEMVQHVRRLQQDHGWLEENWRALGPQLDALSHGQSWVDEQMLAEQAALFKALYHEHIALEESIVYPAARQRELLAHDSAQARRDQWLIA
jgi:hemerythrin-like domain-containing protein